MLLSITCKVIQCEQFVLEYPDCSVLGGDRIELNNSIIKWHLREGLWADTIRHWEKKEERRKWTDLGVSGS